MGVVIFAWKYGYSELKSKKLDAKAAECRENVEKMETETDWPNQNNGYKIHSWSTPSL